MGFDEGGAAALFGDGGAGGGGDDGGAAAAAAAAAGGAGGGSDDGAAAAAAAAAAAGGAGEVPEWMKAFSATPAADGQHSNLDWIKAKGFKDPDALAASLRSAEQLISGKGAIIKPGEGATEAEMAAYHRAIGVPEKVDDYGLSDLPDGAEFDASFLDPMRAIALKAGVPAEGFKALGDAFVQHQLDQAQAERLKQDGLRDTKLREWGGQKDANMVLAHRGVKAFGLTPNDIQSIQRGVGSDRFLDLALKLGQVGGEDMFFGGGDGNKFGITGPEAQAEIDGLIADKDFGAKLRAKDPTAVQRWDRLNAAVAFHKDRERQRQEAGG